MNDTNNKPAQPFISEGDKHLFRTLLIFAKMLGGLGFLAVAFVFFGWLVLIPFALGGLFYVASEMAKKKT